jgi:hypothetical protein
MDFSDLNVSTQTVIAMNNWYLDIPRLFNELPITPYMYVPTPRKNPKKKTPIKNDVNLNKLPSGSIITLKYKDETRGVDIKELMKVYSHRVTKKPQPPPKKKSFRNSMMIVMKVGGKKITFKLPHYGKIQMCGCKEAIHAEKCVKHIWKHVYRIKKRIPGIAFTLEKFPCFVETLEMKKIHASLSKRLETEKEGKDGGVVFDYEPHILFLIVMVNKDFNLDFLLDREKLSIHINKNTQYKYKCILETSVNTSAVVKVESVKENRPPLRGFKLKSRRWEPCNMGYVNYVSQLNKDGIKKASEVKYHSFLMFHSGSTIQSSPYIEEMEIVYNTFMNFIRENKEYIRETLEVNDKSVYLQFLEGLS